MSHYAVTERRIAPGRVGEYLEAIEGIHRSLAPARGRLTLRVYLSEVDPSAVLAVSGWTQRLDFATAEPLVDPAQSARLGEVTLEAQPLRWFVTEREITTFIAQPTVAVASLLAVAPAHMASLLAWARRGQDRVAQMDEVITTQVLRAEDDPGQLLLLIEYRDGVARSTVQAIVGADRPPVPLLHSRVFVGRVGRRWERGDPV